MPKRYYEEIKKKKQKITIRSQNIFLYKWTVNKKKKKQSQSVALADTVATKKGTKMKKTYELIVSDQPVGYARIVFKCVHLKKCFVTIFFFGFSMFNIMK